MQLPFRPQRRRRCTSRSAILSSSDLGAADWDFMPPTLTINVPAAVLRLRPANWSSFAVASSVVTFGGTALTLGTR
eukprot:7511302-Pyramimonas_sp.AAC.1